MKEIKKTLAILKARWPEVILILGINLLLVLVNLVLSPKSMQVFWWYRGIFPLIFILILTTLRSGFLRTVYLEGQKRQSFLVLLRTGLHFLWRLIVLDLLFCIPSLILILLNIHLVSGRVSHGETDILHNIFLIRHLLVLVINIILMKFILLMPALVIVLDCRAFESFRFLKYCRLRDARELIVLFCFKMAFPYLRIFLRTLYDTTTIPQRIFSIFNSVATCFIGLIIVVMAVRFVDSLNLVYGNKPSPLDFEDSRK